MMANSSFFDRLMALLIPRHFSSGRYAFHAKVLCLFALTVGGLAALILAGLTFSEGNVPGRRLGTVMLASMLLAVVFLIRFVRKIEVVAWYVIGVTVAIVWYVDFNNQAISGPNSPLWVVPFALSALVLKRRQLIVMTFIILALFFMNIVLLVNGYLPEPLVKPTEWPKVEIIYLIASGIVVMVCTRGMAKVAHEHLDELQNELDEKQHRIKQINDLKIKAEASIESKTMFLATMSHELRTPLNSVIGNAQLLARENLSSKLSTRVNDISSAGNLLLTLINNILDFSKLEQDKLIFVETAYDLSAQITDLCRMMKSRLQIGVELKLLLPPNAVVISADQSRLAQVLMNLLSNAFKFTDSGSVTVSLETKNAQDVLLSVADTGSGIQTQDLDKIFTQFSQVAGDSEKNIEGTGLGLGICKGIIEQMGGEIKVASEFGNGSCFLVTLPGRVTANTSLPTQESTLPELEGFSLEHTSTLIVDDIEMNCIVLEDMLVDFGAKEFSAVRSGQEAIEFIETSPDTNVILMDVRMPKMNGLQATEKIREMGYQGVVIAVTANATLEDQMECFDAGMDAFIAKPVVMDVLKRKLAELLNPPDNH